MAQGPVCPVASLATADHGLPVRFCQPPLRPPLTLDRFSGCHVLSYPAGNDSPAIRPSILPNSKRTRVCKAYQSWFSGIGTSGCQFVVDACCILNIAPPIESHRTLSVGFSPKKPSIQLGSIASQAPPACRANRPCFSTLVVLKNKAQNATFLPTQRPQKQISVAVA